MFVATWALIATAVVAAEPAVPAAADATAAPTKPALDLIAVVSLVMGGTDEPQKLGPMGGVEGALLVRLSNFGVGPRLELDVNEGNVGLQGGLQAGLLVGAMLPVWQRYRLDLMVEPGVKHYTKNGHTAVPILPFPVTESTTGSAKTLPSIGFRAGFTSLGPKNRSRLAFSLFTRFVARAQVDYQVQGCGVFGCSTGTQTAQYGGFSAGMLMSWQWDWRIDLPRRSPELDPSPPATGPEGGSPDTQARRD